MSFCRRIFSRFCSRCNSFGFSCPAVLGSCRFFGSSSSAGKLSPSIRNEALSSAIENTLLLFICDHRPRDITRAKLIPRSGQTYKIQTRAFPIGTTSGKSLGYFCIHGKPELREKVAIWGRSPGVCEGSTHQIKWTFFTGAADQPSQSARYRCVFHPPDEG